MQRHPDLFSLRFACSMFVAWFSAYASIRAQEPPPTPPNPQAPVLGPAVPLGMQRGTSMELTLTGANLTEPTGVWTSFPGRVTIPTDKNNGKEPGKLRVQLDVPGDAPLGFHSLRLATAHGMSNLRLFCIDELPQVMEVDSNRSRSTPQSVPVPCVVVGRADAEIADYYRINVRAGQRVSFEVLGRRLGSALDPQITLLDPKSGRELPGGHNNDAPGLQTDSRLTYLFKEAGEYLIEIRDTMWRGGADFWYRLRIGDFPCATTPVPMAARRGTQVTVHFAGPMVEGVAPVEVTVPNDSAASTISLAPRGPNGLHGWPVALALSNFEEVLEQEPNNEPGQANRIPVPGGVTGRFQQPGDVDHFVFAARKGQRYLVKAHTVELNSPTEVYMVLKDAKGGQVAASNPTVTASLDFTAPADGDYTLAVEHLLYAGGPSETYRITVEPFEPSFDLALGIEQFDVAAGSSTPIVLYATRNGYAGPIEVRVSGDPHISGHATIKAGQPAAPNQPAATLFLHAAADAPAGPFQIAIEGSATIDGRSIVRRANLHNLVSKSLAGLPFPPQNLLTQVGLAVTPRPPFLLSLHFDYAEGTRGYPVPLTIRATRDAGFAEEIALAPANLPPNVAAAFKNIPRGQNEVKVQLNPAANAALGIFPVTVTGKAKYQGKDHLFTSEPVALVLAPPFSLQVEPAAIKLTPGSKTRIKISAVRAAVYQGPIAIELRNLPAGVTATKGMIGQGQTSLDLELTAPANAAAGDKADVQALGTATAAANQQQASPNLVINILKK